MTAITRRELCLSAAAAPLVAGNVPLPAAARSPSDGVRRARGTITASDGQRLAFEETTLLSWQEHRGRASELRRVRRQFVRPDGLVEIIAEETAPGRSEPGQYQAQWRGAPVRALGGPFAAGPVEWRAEGVVAVWKTEDAISA